MHLLGRSTGLMRAFGKSWGIAANYIDCMLGPFDFRNVPAVYPNQTFETSFELDLDGRRIEIREFGPAHTSSDSMVYLPDDGILIAADLQFIGVIPVIWEGSSRNWIDACDWIIGKRPDRILPGHGPLSDSGGAEILRSYLDLLRSAGRDEFNQGRDPVSAARQILASNPYQRQPFATWDGQERIAINLHSLFRRLSGEDGHMGILARLRALHDAALLAEELPRVKKQGVTDIRA
jgi:glyoxylase-like metal-dependent hydrolase (beta-lactamase superfamily II)